MVSGWRGILNTTGLWSEESVGIAWGLDIGHRFESVMSRMLEGALGGLIWVVESDVLVGAV